MTSNNNLGSELGLLANATTRSLLGDDNAYLVYNNRDFFSMLGSQLGSGLAVRANRYMASRNAANSQDTSPASQGAARAAEAMAARVARREDEDERIDPLGGMLDEGIALAGDTLGSLWEQAGNFFSGDGFRTDGEIQVAEIGDQAIKEFLGEQKYASKNFNKQMDTNVAGFVMNEASKLSSESLKKLSTDDKEYLIDQAKVSGATPLQVVYAKEKMGMEPTDQERWEAYNEYTSLMEQKAINEMNPTLVDRVGIPLTRNSINIPRYNKSNQTQNKDDTLKKLLDDVKTGKLSPDEIKNIFKSMKNDAKGLSLYDMGQATNSGYGVYADAKQLPIQQSINSNNFEVKYDEKSNDEILKDMSILDDKIRNAKVVDAPKIIEAMKLGVRLTEVQEKNYKAFEVFSRSGQNIPIELRDKLEGLANSVRIDVGKINYIEIVGLKNQYSVKIWNDRSFWDRAVEIFDAIRKPRDVRQERYNAERDMTLKLYNNLLNDIGNTLIQDYYNNSREFDDGPDYIK